MVHKLNMFDILCEKYVQYNGALYKYFESVNFLNRI